MKTIHFILLFSGLCFSCSPNNVERANELKKYFDEKKIEGCFALYNNATNNFTVYNLERYRDSSYAPGATFNLLVSLIGLQEGTIVDDSMVLAIDQSNQPQTMLTAFRLGTTSYFQKIAIQLGEEKIQGWLDSLSYGSKKIKTTVDAIWFDNTLKITPDEQLGIIRKLYFNQLPFHQLNQEIVRRTMLMENNTKYKLSYIAGGDKSSTEWLMGWVEENNHPYFFVLNTTRSAIDGTQLSGGNTLLLQILKELGFLEGKM